MLRVFALITLATLLIAPACGSGRTGRVFRGSDVMLTYRPRGEERPGNVYISGSFNAWHISNPAFKCIWDPLEEGYSVGFQLEPGRYEYRFVVDGRWVHDPDARESAPDPLGGRLGVFYVIQADSQ